MGADFPTSQDGLIDRAEGYDPVDHIARYRMLIDTSPRSEYSSCHLRTVGVSIISHIICRVISAAPLEDTDDCQPALPPDAPCPGRDGVETPSRDGQVSVHRDPR